MQWMQVLYVMWQHKELHDTFKRAGLKEADFYAGTSAAGHHKTTTFGAANQHTGTRETGWGTGSATRFGRIVSEQRWWRRAIWCHRAARIMAPRGSQVRMLAWVKAATCFFYTLLRQSMPSEFFFGGLLIAFNYLYNTLCCAGCLCIIPCTATLSERQGRRSTSVAAFQCWSAANVRHGQCHIMLNFKMTFHCCHWVRLLLESRFNAQVQKRNDARGQPMNGADSWV